MKIVFHMASLLAVHYHKVPFYHWSLRFLRLGSEAPGFDPNLRENGLFTTYVVHR